MQEETGRSIHMYSSVFGPKAKKKLSISDLPKLPPAPIKEDAKLLKFKDLRRIEIITREREQNIHDSKAATGNQMTFPPLKQQPPISSLANLKPLFLSDIDLQKDAVYKGYFFIFLQYY